MAVALIPPPGRIGVVLRPERDLAAPLSLIARWAASAGVTLAGATEEERLPYSAERSPDPAWASSCDLVLALGGDGTVLGALDIAAPYGVPVLGVNLGRLGYLTEIDAPQLESALAALARGEFGLEKRTALLLHDSNGDRVAYNDVVLSRVPGCGQAALGLSVEGELLVRYSSDGVIVATPAGSTAYSFAAGGPLISPRTHGMVVTPDAPHGLFNRAVVLAEDERLEIEVLAASAPLSIEVDGRLAGRAQPGDRMSVTRHARSALVARLHRTGFAERARHKLGITDPAVLADFDPAGHVR